MTQAAPVRVVAGAPGAGKSTVAGLLLQRLRPLPAALDEAAPFGGLVGALLAAHGRPHGGREGPWYGQHVEPTEYGALTAAARHVRAAARPVLLDAPFTGQVRGGWSRRVGELRGAPVHPLWVRNDPRTLRSRLERRARPEDAGKLAAYDELAARTQPDDPPPAPHHQGDTRAGASPLTEQVDTPLARP